MVALHLSNRRQPERETGPHTDVLLEKIMKIRFDSVALRKGIKLSTDQIGLLKYRELPVRNMNCRIVQSLFELDRTPFACRYVLVHPLSNSHLVGS